MLNKRELVKLLFYSCNKNQIKTLSSSIIPKAPTWDLIKIPEDQQKRIHIDAQKLQNLSLLTVNDDLIKKLEDVVSIVERMCQLDIDKKLKPLIYFKHLGVCEMRKDDAKLYNGLVYTKDDIIGNAKEIYDDYFIAPSGSGI